MTPREKAKYLIVEMWVASPNMRDEAKRCAIICVDEILELNVTWNSQGLIKDYPSQGKADSTYEYWQEVKKEIKEL